MTNAEKTPETPRSDIEIMPGRFVGPLRPEEVAAFEALKAKVAHLEGALREAEQERDSAIDALTTTQADWTDERQQFADEVSAYRIKLREAEAKIDRLKCKGMMTHCDHWWDGDPCCGCGHPGAGDEVTEEEEQCRHAFVPVTKVFCKVCGNEDAHPMHAALLPKAGSS